MRNREIAKEKEVKHIIIISLLVIISTVLGYIAISSYVDIKKSKSNEYVAEDLWEKAYQEVEATLGKIQFKEIDTTPGDYARLRLACRNYVESLDDPFDKTLNVDVTVNEQIYADDKKTIKSNKKPNASGIGIPDLVKMTENAVRKSNAQKYNLVETEPIYLDNMLMIRYINNSGNLAVLTGAIDNNEIVVLGQSKLKDYIDKQDSLVGQIETKTETLENENKNNVATDNSWNNGSIPEDEFIKQLLDCVEKIILSNNEDDTRDIVYETVKYTTQEGKQSIMEASGFLNLGDNTTLERSVILFGKSDQSIDYKDRLYVRYDVNGTNEIDGISIVIKLNTDYKIFDIDIV